MQTFAVVLMTVGALLNTVVLVYFAWRALRAVLPARYRHKAQAQPTLVPANR